MTFEEMVAELDTIYAQQNNPEGAMTTEDWADALGLGLAAARRRIKAAQKAGRIEITSVVRPNMSGRMQRREAYRLIPAEM